MSRFKKDFDWDQITRDKEPEEEIVFVSRSELRRDGEKLLDIVKWIIELSPAQYEKLNLDESLHHEVEKARKLTLSARKRQAMTIAKKMRNIYPRIEDMKWLDQSIDKIERPHHEENLQFNVSEIARTWQQQLLQGAMKPSQLAQQYTELDQETLEGYLVVCKGVCKNEAKTARQNLLKYLEQTFTQILKRIS